jgi:DNA polymerase III gamma/tau subunit
MVERKKVPHTILLHGPSGCGKTSVARILRRMLKCHPTDCIEMNCSSFRGIDTIRDIQRLMVLSPVGGKCRVWLLDEVHQLSKDGQHSALKMLEDTPSHVYFILCTTEPQKLLPTVRGRCTEFALQALNTEQLASLVASVARSEAIKLGDGVSIDIAEAARYSARNALVLLDRIRHLNPKRQSAGIGAGAEEEKEAIDLCRLLLKKAAWPQVGRVLKGMKPGTAEETRRAVLGYMRSVLLTGGSPQAYNVLRAFEGNFYDTGDAGLVLACYEAVSGD